MEFSFKDQFRTMIECATDGLNTVMYDEYGNPNVMVWVPKDYYESVFGESCPKTGPLPAFITEGREIEGFWISKYSSGLGDGGVPISMPDLFPHTGYTFIENKQKMRKKGKGWHQMTNFEYMAIICNHYGRSQDGYWTGNSNNDINSTSKIIAGISKDDGVIKSGSGGLCTTHDYSNAGIFDLFGNTWEFVDGWKQDTKSGNIWSHGQSMDELMNMPFSDKYVMSPFQFNCLSGDPNNLWIDDSDDDPHMPPSNNGFAVYKLPIKDVNFTTDFKGDTERRRCEAVALGVIPMVDSTNAKKWDAGNVPGICKYALNSKVKVGEEYVRNIRGGDVNLGCHPNTYASIYRDTDEYTCISGRAVYISMKCKMLIGDKYGFFIQR